MEPELTTQKTALLAEIKVLYPISVSLVIKFLLFVQKTKNAWGTTVEILHVPKVRIALMIGKHAVVENVLTLAST